jgi:hypothetical protein
MSGVSVAVHPDPQTLFWGHPPFFYAANEKIRHQTPLKDWRIASAQDFP